MTEDWPEWRIPAKRAETAFPLHKKTRAYAQRSQMDKPRPVKKDAAPPEPAPRINRRGKPLSAFQCLVLDSLRPDEGIMASELAALLNADQQRMRNTLNQLYVWRMVTVEKRGRICYYSVRHSC